MDKMHNTDDMVSALADGQLRGADFAHAVEAVAADPAARERWHLYHVVGDVLRSGDMARASMDAGFAARLRERLRQEQPGVFTTPVATDLVADQATSVRPAGDLMPKIDVRREAANGWGWKLVAGVASLAAVGAVAWNVAGPARAPQAELARATPAPTLAVPMPATAVAGAPAAGAATGGAVMIRDPRLDELLAAHRQGGASALQMPSGFLRNATFEAPGR